MIVLIGIPGSGKSTWAAAQGATVISSDALRLLLSGNEENQAIHGKVFATMRYLLRTRLEIGASPTIIDATNLRRRDRKKWLQLAKKHDAIIEAMHFDVALETALERNAARTRQVPEEIIRSMHAGLQPPTEAEGFSSVVTISA